MSLNILENIILEKRKEVAKLVAAMPISVVQECLRHKQPPRDFLGAIKSKTQNGNIAVIAEIKKASPSKGLIRPKFEPEVIAKSYEENGAACLSVLTDQKFFQGSVRDLMRVRAISEIPILRKDFIVDAYQIAEARLVGADCILLIAAALETSTMREFEELALNYEMAVLVEVHDQQELEQALTLKTPLIGINNRNLRTFLTDIKTTIDMVQSVPKDKIIVTESGVSSTSDVEQIFQSGVKSFLVGEAFMRQPDPGRAMMELFKI